jgi:hypothetical protein
MLSKLGTVVLCLLFYAAVDCAAQTKMVKGSGADACALVASSEVEAVQGGRVAAARAARVVRGPLTVAQCHYAVTAPDRPGQNLGVLVEVRSGAPAELAAEWEKLGAKKENKRSERPRPVEGVGRGAYWVGSDRLGALYVLGPDRIVYVSLGGPGEVGDKIEKSKRLALRALARL